MCLLFGLLGPCICLFTKLLCPMVRYWWAKGRRVIVYLNDDIGMAQRDKLYSASNTAASWFCCSFSEVPVGA